MAEVDKQCSVVHQSAPGHMPRGVLFEQLLSPSGHSKGGCGLVTHPCWKGGYTLTLYSQQRVC
jgi:hypothetical protein